MAVSIRDARVDDAVAIGAIHVATWRSTYRGMVPDRVLERLSESSRAEQWRARLERPPDHSRVLVAEVEGRVVGFVACGPEPGTDRGEVYAVYVEPQRQGIGAGRGLLERAVAHLESAGFAHAVLWVLAANAPARAFYERLGWQPDGREQDIDFDGTPVAEVRYAVSLVSD